MRAEGEDIYDHNVIDKKLWEVLIVCFALIRHGPRRKQNNQTRTHRHTDAKMFSKPPKENWGDKKSDSKVIS
jgi:hypothetical protein